MHSPPSIWAQWHASPALLLLVAGLAAAYFGLSGGRWQARGGLYFTALGLLALVEASPLHYLGMHALFSAHMVVHIVVLLLCGPLLVLGLPPALPSTVARRLARFSGWLRGHTWLAWLAGVGIMWGLHVPAVFDASFGGLDAAFGLPALLPVVAMLLAGALFSWPLVGPTAEAHLHPLAGVVYLFSACVGCSLLGLLITFAPADTYQHYARAGWCGTPSLAPDFASNPWGLSLADDQQAAGLIMWVPCCFIYLGGCMYLVAKYFMADEGVAPPPAPPLRGRGAIRPLTLASVRLPSPAGEGPGVGLH
ncbi:cytochrome c oxidase assembly protein [Hymenobacter sp. RP-2-7]|uniref:Cytochrome c oxidase assembly protein n=1 Tax=Hymenobacter polaris TaxID=2682546 RepID=A0A7Y0FME5_9BACT|nr:cytochrome c oxidase assembly protein [Hymenobacter polaris]NML65431.1 cytochrome c oxidase assembly protein [Hymenobacter polaris]